MSFIKFKSTVKGGQHTGTRYHFSDGEVKKIDKDISAETAHRLVSDFPQSFTITEKQAKSEGDKEKRAEVDRSMKPRVTK